MVLSVLSQDLGAYNEVYEKQRYIMEMTFRRRLSRE